MSKKEAKDVGFQKGRRLLSHLGTFEDERKYARGRMTEMFPYVVEASKKMGIRSISRWLAEEGYSISPPTISRALANPEPHWSAFANRVKPHVERVMGFYGITDFDFLVGNEVFVEVHGHAVSRFDDVVSKAEDRLREKDEFKRVESVHESEWFLRHNFLVLSIESRTKCVEYFSGSVSS